MEFKVNETKIDNPFIIAALIVFSIAVVGIVIAVLLFVVLPIIGIVLSGMLALILVILTPILFWLVIPVVMLTIVGWCFAKVIK
ncbi:MAG: hypothetical protein ABJJ44_15295 [Paraglaciecola sp.]|uniref:hypothetical protein n=1 Tax=Paraglaciecola sp. TaxID=1920173 RepID=UPI0032987FFF